MKKLLIILSTLAVTAGCTKDFDKKPEQPDCKSFDVRVHAVQPQTRTQIDGTTLKWSTGDKIGVFVDGVQYNRSFDCVDAVSGAFKGSFLVTEESKPSIKYYAYYPFVFQGMTVNSTVIGAKLPFRQNAPFDSSADFMISEPVTGSYDEMNFSPVSFTFSTHLFSIVRVTVKNTKEELKDEKLLSVMLHSPGVALSGNFTLDAAQPTAPAVFSDQPEDVYERVESVFPSGTEPTLGLGVEHVVYLVVKPNSEPISSLTFKVKTTNTVSEFTSAANVVFTAGQVVSLPSVDLSNATQSKRMRKIVLWGDSITSDTFLKYTRQVLGDDWEVVRAGVAGDVSLGIATRQGGMPMVTGNAFTLPASSSESVVIDGFFSLKDFAGNTKLTSVMRESWFMPSNSPQLNPCTIQGVECNVSYDSANGFTLNRVSDGEPVSVSAHSAVETYGAKDLRDADLIVIYMGANGGGHRTYQVLCDQHSAMIDYTDKKEAIVLGFSMDISLQWGTSGYWSQEYVDLFTGKFGRRFVDMRTEGSRRAASLLVQTGVIFTPNDMSKADRDAVAIGDWPESFFTSSSDNVHPNAVGSHVMALLLRERMEELGYFD